MCHGVVKFLCNRCQSEEFTRISLLYARHVSASNNYECRFAGSYLEAASKKGIIQKLMNDVAFNAHNT
jgi:hypothetical protein